MLKAASRAAVVASASSHSLARRSVQPNLPVIARLQKRNYRLLPSQSLSLLQSYVPVLFSGIGDRQPRLASSAKEVRNILEGESTAFPIHLQADIIDGRPDEGHFMLDGFPVGLTGTRHSAASAEEAAVLARMILDSRTSFHSAAAPFAHKIAPRVICQPALQESSTSNQAHTLRLLLSADRQPHHAGQGTFFGPTLTIAAIPPALPLALAQQLVPDRIRTIGVDITALMHAKNIGEVSPLQTGQNSSAKGSQSNLALEKVAEKIASDVVQEASTLTSLSSSASEALANSVQGLFTLFWRGEGERFSIDTALTKEGIALLQSDLQFDDFSQSRQKELAKLRADGQLLWQATDGVTEAPSRSGAESINSLKHEMHELEEMADKTGLVFRKHRGGNVGLFGYGAGMGMGSVDGLIEEGGKPANFFDGGGGASIENSKEAMRILSLDPDVKVILINIFGGITRSDLVSQGVLQAFEEYNIQVPLVARFRGNKAQEAQETLRSSGLNVELFDDYRPAARRASEIANAASRPAPSPSAASKSKSQGARGLHTMAVVRPQVAGLKESKAVIRSFSSSSHLRMAHVHALTGYAFAGKPRYPESGNAAEESQSIEKATNSSSKLPTRQGFPIASPIGSWIDQLLHGGEAGEDALSVHKMKGEGDWFLGVADGVGGWSENGVDPALFSQALMYHASQYAKGFHACPDRIEAEDLANEKSPPASPLNTPLPSPGKTAASRTEPGTPLDILQWAYQNTLAQPEVPAGSATACFLSFDSSKGILRTANLGDSGFIVLRPGPSTNASKPSPTDQSASQNSASSADHDDAMATGMHTVHYQSKPQTHGFNTPLQLSKLPPEFRFDGSIDSQPSHADIWSGRLQDGDIVLAGTDGFWDNVSAAEILQLVAFIRQKHRTAWIDKMSDISADDLAEERDLANVLAHK